MTFEQAMAFTVDQLTAGFLNLRDQIKAREAELVEALKPSKETLEVLRNALAKKLQDMGANSVKTLKRPRRISRSSPLRKWRTGPHSTPSSRKSRTPSCWSRTPTRRRWKSMCNRPAGQCPVSN